MVSEPQGPPGAADARGLLHLIAAEPSLLAPAPEEPSTAELHLRVGYEEHLCLSCGDRATVAAIVNSEEAGSRWLDLCSACWTEVQVANEVPEEDAWPVNPDGPPPSL
ncbi:hypothetical protein [Streptomyces sp. NPDC097619]|uniref:hypothetical protein n=1 Tax=Streptomyces sp. NPDC097619 TaxID=3157228 RepID=UPI00331CF4CB